MKSEETDRIHPIKNIEFRLNPKSIIINITNFVHRIRTFKSFKFNYSMAHMLGEIQPFKWYNLCSTRLSLSNKNSKSMSPLRWTMYFTNMIRNNVCEHVTIININSLTLVSLSNWFVEFFKSECLLCGHWYTWLTTWTQKRYQTWANLYVNKNLS